MSKMFAKQLLLTNNYWVLNKTMVQLLGLEGAFLLSSFAEAENMMADGEGWFYQTSDTVERITTLSRHKQDQAIKKMKDLGVIEQSNRGVPPKRYFKINYECLTNQFANILQIEQSKIDKLNCKKSATNKESNYKENNYKENTGSGSDFKDIVHKFQDNGFGLINAGTSETLTDLTEIYSDSWVLEAMDIAIDNNKRNLGYVKGILKKWEAEGKDNDTRSKGVVDPYAGMEVY